MLNKKISIFMIIMILISSIGICFAIPNVKADSYTLSGFSSNYTYKYRVFSVSGAQGIHISTVESSQSYKLFSPSVSVVSFTKNGSSVSGFNPYPVSSGSPLNSTAIGFESYTGGPDNLAIYKTSYSGISGAITFEFSYSGKVYQNNTGSSGLYTDVSGSLIFEIDNINTDGQYHTLGSVSMTAVLSISPSGSSWVGGTSLFSTVITGGTSPYTTTYNIIDTKDNSVVYNGTSTSHVWSDIGIYTIQATVVDSLSVSKTSNTITYTVNNLRSLYIGQIMTLEGAPEGMVRMTFILYLPADDVVGAPMNATVGIDTHTYTFITPTYSAMGVGYYQVEDIYLTNMDGELFNISLNITDSNTGGLVHYNFVFDTSLADFSLIGTWMKSNGTYGNGASADLPSWFDAIIEALKDIFKWLFVPSDSQLNSLLPSGTYGDSLNIFSGFEWGSTTTGIYNFKIHFPKVDSGDWEITILSINFTTLETSTFITILRTANQTLIALTLVFICITALVV